MGRLKCLVQYTSPILAVGIGIFINTLKKAYGRKVISLKNVNININTDNKTLEKEIKSNTSALNR